MSKLEELIKKHCPNGVEYKKIEEFIDYIQPGKYIVESTKYDDSFKTPVLTAGQTFILGYTKETKGIFPASKEKPVIIFDDFTAGFHWVDFNFKVKSSALKILIPKKNINFRYFYHIMGNLNIHSSEHTRLWISSYSQIEIPLPPLPVQEEIVRILDNFTQLTAELTAELTARRAQYEYYRDALSMNIIATRCCHLSEATAVRWITLGEIASYSTLRIDAQVLTSKNYVGVDNLLQNKQGKTISEYVPAEGRFTKFVKEDILIGNIRPYLRKIWLADCDGGTNGDVLVIHFDKTKFNSKYMYYVLSSESFFIYDTNHSKGAKMPRGSKDAVMDYRFPLPSLDEQERIASILDRFESLCNDISSGLPAEIEARKKQYEYYRDKLLTFKKSA